MTTITNPREVLLPYIGHFLDDNERYQLNGFEVEGKNVALSIHDRKAESESDAQIAWLADGIDTVFAFLEKVGFPEEHYANLTFPLSGKLA